MAAPHASGYTSRGSNSLDKLEHMHFAYLTNLTKKINFIHMKIIFEIHIQELAWITLVMYGELMM
jgi:hypothetical protein